MTRRVEQVSSTLRQAIEQVLARGLQDPRVSGLITVVRCDLAEDLRSATIWVSVLPEDRQARCIAGLRAAARHVRHEVGELIEMRRVPDLTFKLDTSLKHQAAVIDALARVDAERAARATPGTAGGPTEDPSP